MAIGLVVTVVTWGIRVELALATLRSGAAADKETAKSALVKFDIVVAQLSEMRQDFAAMRADFAWIKRALLPKAGME